MEYFIGALMGYFVGTNALVEKQEKWTPMVGHIS